MQHNQTVTPVCQTVVHHFYGCMSGDDKQWCWHWVFLSKAAIKHWEKLALTLSCGFASPLQWLQKLWFENFFHWTIFHVVCLQRFVMVLQKTFGPFFFFIDVKRLLGMQKPVFVFSTVMNRGLLCITGKFLVFHYKQIIAWPVCGILL